MLPSPLSGAQEVAKLDGAKRPATSYDAHENGHLSKRQAIEVPSAMEPSSQQAAPENVPSASARPGDNLRNKTIEELIDVILQMQSSYDHQFATLSAQYHAVNLQLLDLKKCISTFFSAQSAAMDSAAALLFPHEAPRPIAPQAPRPIPAPSMANPPTYAPTASQSSSIHPSHQNSPPSPPILHTSAAFVPPTQPASVPPSTSTPRRDSIASPTSTINDTPSSTNGMATHFTAIPTEDDRPPSVIYSTANSVADVWAEYRYGIDGQPSIESLDAAWGPRWRPEPRGRTWYSRRKIIWDKIKELIHDGLDERTAVAEIEHMRAGRSMNWLMNILQNNRKETKASWKAAAAAATAAKEASKAAAPQVTTFEAGPGTRY